MINILTYTPGPKDPTSFYRGLLPLYELQRTHREFRIIEGDLMRLGWPQIAQADIVFIQRPHQPVYRHVAEIAKAMDKPLWVDLDDDHLNVPVYYDIHKLYNDVDNRQAHIDCVKMADVLTVSTQQLATNYSHLNRNIEVIPNALPDFLFTWPLPKREPGPVRILWRGSEKHSYDLAMYLPQLNEIIEMPGVEMIFFGYKPEVKEAANVKFVEHTPPGDILAYFRKLLELQPDIVIVPLTFTDFNKCKSNNAEEEGYWVTAHCVAPEMFEWRNAIASYSTPEGFVGSVRALIGLMTYDDRKNFLRNNANRLSTTNRLRFQVANNLIVGKYKPVTV